MRQRLRLMNIGIFACLAAATACSAAVEATPPATSTSTLSTSTSSTTSTPSTSTSSTTTTTSTPTTTVPTTTATTVPTIDIEGSPMIEFSIEVDEEAFAGELTETAFTTFVVETLADERSWTGRGVGFRLVEEGGLFTITVATPERTDQLCWPLRTNGRFSCAQNGWIVFNSDRWFGATESWPGDLETYRHYLVNHEIGHYIMGAGHDGCPGAGELAPVMMQQTKGLDGCEPNGWVDP